MFVSIDMDALRFLHRHPDHETISALSWLECGQHTSILIEPCQDNSVFLRNLSDLDVRMLYKNSTGAELPKDADAAALRYYLGDAVQLMNMTRCLTHEVLAQVALVDDRLHEGERFAYAFGSLTPAQPGELFPLKARPLTEAELARAHSNSRNPVRGYPPRLTGQPRKPWEDEGEVAEMDEIYVGGTPIGEVSGAVVVSAPKAAKARAGSVQPVVFEQCQKAWDNRAEGATWEQVRAALVEVLTGPKFDFHPTTVRIKLSKWAKENAI